MVNRLFSTWMSWRAFLEVAADFAFIAVVMVTAVKWVGAGLEFDTGLVVQIGRAHV